MPGLRDLRGGLPGGGDRTAPGFSNEQILAQIEGLLLLHVGAEALPVAGD